MGGAVAKEPVAVLDREMLIGLGQIGHLPVLPSLEAWKAMASADRQALIAAVLAYGDRRIPERNDGL